MFGTEKRMPIDVTDHGRVNTSLIVASMLLAAAISYVLVVLHPGLVKGIGALFGHAMTPANGNSQWAVPTIAAAAAIGAASLAMLVLSAFISGVQRAPYLWLSPVLVGFSSLVLARLPVQLPFAGLSVPLLSALAGLLLLGGGALLQLRGAACAFSGSLLLLLPGSTLVAAHIVRAGSAQLAWTRLDMPSALYSFVLIVTTIGMAIIALVTRVGTAGNALHAAARVQQQNAQLTAALEHTRLLEHQLAQSERRAEVAQHQLRARMLTSREDTDAFVTLARPSLGRWLAPFGIALVLTALPLAGYFGAYRPLARRVATQQALAAEAASDHAEQIEALRKRLYAERAEAISALTAERNKTAAALAAVEQAPESAKPAAVVAQPKAPLVQAKAPLVQTKPPVAAPAVAKPQARVPAAAKPQAAAAVVHRIARNTKKVSAARAAPKRAKKLVAPSAKSAEDNAEPDPSRALKESVNDDPIGGLD